MSHGVYAEIMALSQCLPGPASSKISFAIGIVKKGVSGGLLSGARGAAGVLCLALALAWCAAAAARSAATAVRLPHVRAAA